MSLGSKSNIQLNSCICFFYPWLKQVGPTTPWWYPHSIGCSEQGSPLLLSLLQLVQTTASGGTFEGLGRTAVARAATNLQLELHAAFEPKPVAGDLRLQGKLKPDHLEHLVFSHHSLPPAHSICPSWVPGCRLSTAMTYQPRQSQGYSGDKKQLPWKRQGEKLWEITHLDKGKGLSRSYSLLLSFCSGGSYTAR